VEESKEEEMECELRLREGVRREREYITDNI
jgi:hypothetical protein